MDQAYAKLSLEVGWFAALFDGYLGGAYFEKKARAHSWQLTPDWLENLKLEAIEKGVPESIVRSPPDYPQEVFETLFKPGRKETDMKKRADYRPWMCGKCGYAMDAATSLSDDALPTEGSVSLCLNCGAIHVQEGGKWRIMTQAEYQALPHDLKIELLRAELVRRLHVTSDLSKGDPQA